MSVQTFETDWLASQPVFYNEATGRASRNVNDVIEFAELELHPEGLNDYLDHGYCVFQQTPARHVRFLRPSSRLTIGQGGELHIEALPDERLAERIATPTREAAVLELLRAKIEQWQRSVEGDVVIPTSGGLDSRLLNLMIGERSRVRTFSYGVTDRQSDSLEVTRARLLSQLLGTRWEQVPIGNFHLYLDDWDRLFGPAVHAHGMYQIEFYLHVLARVGTGRALLSGLHGDALAGNVDHRIPTVHSPAEVDNLIRSMGMHADSSMSTFPRTHEAREAYFEENKETVTSLPLCIVEALRFGMTLFSYLSIVPEHLGFRPFSPYVDIDVASAMLALPSGRRRDRLWMREYLASQGASLIEATGSAENWLNYHAMRRVPLRPLDAQMLREVVKPDYVHWINRNVGWAGLWSEGFERLRTQRGFRRAAELARRRLDVHPRRSEAYFAYLTLRPIESLLRRRDLAQRHGAQPPAPAKPATLVWRAARDVRASPRRIPSH